MRLLMKRAFFVALFLNALACPAFAQNKPQRFTGTITPTNRKAVYKVKMVTNHIYTIDLESAAFDTFLEVRDARNKLLAENDDGGKGLNSRLLFVPPKDATYHVVARPLGARTGPFSLSIRSLKAVFVTGGKLTRQDALDRVRKRSHHKVHLVKLTAGTRYTIDLTSQKFDTFLRIENVDGTELAQNDDGGDGLNSCLSFQPTATGTYRVIVTAFDDNDLGDYTLVVQKK